MQANHPFWLVIAAGMIALVPILIGILTSYVKISIILSFLRSGLGAQQVPGNLAIMALSLALTAYIMSPVLVETAGLASNIEPKTFTSAPDLKDYEKLTPIFEPWKKFMTKHSGAKEIHVLSQLASSHGSEDVPSDSESSLRVVMPAFVLTEIKAGFSMGFMVLLPFLIIDLAVANILAGMGMYMLSPVIVSLPLKLLLFVMGDGWILLTKGIIQSYA